MPIIKRAALPELPEEDNLHQVRCSKTDQDYQCWYHRGGTKIECYFVETNFDWKWACPGLCGNCLARSADIIQPPAPEAANSRLLARQMFGRPSDQEVAWTLGRIKGKKTDGHWY